MKRTATLCVISAALFVALLMQTTISFAHAQSSYSVTQIDHTVEVLYNGYVIVNDTVSIAGQVPDRFFIGLPYEYGPYVLKGFGYDATGSLPVTLDVPMGVPPRVGFFGAMVDLSQRFPTVFTVGFVLSNDLMTQSSTQSDQFSLSFPAFPSLNQTVAFCNATINIAGATFVSGSGWNASGFAYSQTNLGEFAYRPSTVTFSTPIENLQIADIESLTRLIQISEYNTMTMLDTYRITNKAPSQMTFFDVFLAPNSLSAPTARDQLGRTMNAPTLVDADSNRYRVNLTLSMITGASTTFTVSYSLPQNYIAEKSVNNFDLSLPAFREAEYYVNETSVAIDLPEGAVLQSIQSSLQTATDNVARNVYEDSASVNQPGIIAADNFSVKLAYSYNPLWASFRPTLWIWSLAIVGSVVVALAWRRPKEAEAAYVTSPAGIRIRHEDLKTFVEAYEEKQKIAFELDSLESRVQKGRIPRRRYKVRRKTLESRLETLDRSIAELRARIRSAGGRYSEHMLQLEVEESEIAEVDAGVKNIEGMHARGELSLEAYRKRLDNFQRRKENAETNINGILLRLREEMR